MHETKSEGHEWYRMEGEALEKVLHSSIRDGLTSKAALSRVVEVGPNAFASDKGVTPIDRIVGELKNPLTFILLCAGIVTTFLGEYVDSTVIFVALIINIAISLYQEGRADRAFLHLRQSQEKFAIVIRDGAKERISAESLVPGDVISLETGMNIPADVRIVKSSNLEVNESPLTGEWIDVEKMSEAYDTVIPLIEQRNMGFMGTLITAGSGMGIVVETGNRTKIGTIAALLDVEPLKTPLQENIANVARLLSYIVVGALAVIFILGFFRGVPFTELLLISIAIAVAAIPEGLPAAVTVILAIGMEAILARGGLVRNLLAAETLGSTTLILTDKTGTLTKAEMVVAKVLTCGGMEAERNLVGHKLHEVHGDERDVLEFAALASDAFIEERGDDFHPPFDIVVRGRPVERAVVSAALASGLNQTELLTNYPRIDFLPFESKYRMALSLHHIRGLKHNRLYVTGAPEVLLEHSSAVYCEGKSLVDSDERKLALQHALKKYTMEGKRLIGVAYRDTMVQSFAKDDGTLREKLTEGLTLAGFIVMHDPLREDVTQSIREAQHAGARVVMVTGDNLNTARTIALECGIWKDGDGALEGVDVERATDAELGAALKHTTVFARMLPEHKLRLARVLQAAGEIVAMTGDGVNDAPALRAANIGVALGSATEVAKEASDLILLNNSFSIMVAAIEEGRRIIDNLRKVVAYLLSTSFSEIIVVGGALVLGLPMPFLPSQILWTNMLTEGFMNFAFAFEPKEDDVMRRDPRVAGARNMLSSRFKAFIIVVGMASGFLLLTFYILLSRVWRLSDQDARTIMFVALTLGTTLIAFSLKDLRTPLYKIRLWSNRYLLGSTLFALFGLTVALRVPLLRELLRLTPINIFSYWHIILFMLFLTILSVELAKFFLFEFRRERVVR